MNKHGEALIDFLLSTKMCVLNGRVKGDNGFTCISTKGKSVVDYFITYIECVQYCKEMNVVYVKDILQEIKLIPIFHGSN